MKLKKKTNWRILPVIMTTDYNSGQSCQVLHRRARPESTLVQAI